MVIMLNGDVVANSSSWQNDETLDDETRQYYQRMLSWHLVKEDDEEAVNGVATNEDGDENLTKQLYTMAIDEVGKLYDRINHMSVDELRSILRLIQLDTR